MRKKGNERFAGWYQANHSGFHANFHFKHIMDAWNAGVKAACHEVRNHDGGETIDGKFYKCSDSECIAQDIEDQVLVSLDE
jgi:hypothetical protein